MMMIERRFIMQLTQRDFELLRCIGYKLGFALTSHVAKLLFPNRKVASRRLLMLKKEGYLHYIVRPSTEKGRTEYTYFITQKTASLICENSNQKPSIPALKELAHTLLINEFIVSLELASKRDGLEFEYVKDDYLRKNSRFEKFIQATGSQVQVMYPDIVFCLKNSDGRKALFLVEAERETLLLKSTKTTSIKEKVITMANYLDYNCQVFFNELFGYSFTGFRYLILTSGHKERIKNIISACSQANQDFGFTWITSIDGMTEKNVFNSIWCKLDPNDSKLYSLIK